MSYFCQKSTFLQLKHIQRIYLILLSSTCVKNSPNSLCHFGNHKPFFTTQLLCIQSAHFQTFPLLELKLTKFLMLFFKQKVSFLSKFCVMRDNSSLLFIAETLSAINKRNPSKCTFLDFCLLT